MLCAVLPPATHSQGPKIRGFLAELLRAQTRRTGLACPRTPAPAFPVADPATHRGAHVRRFWTGRAAVIRREREPVYTESPVGPPLRGAGAPPVHHGGSMISSLLSPGREATGGTRKQLRRCRTVGLIWALVLFTAAPLLAQTGEITGTVVSGGTGLPLADVQLSVSGTQLGAQTNQDGRFVIADVPVGEHQLVAQLIGYGEESATVTVTAQSAVTVELELRTRAVELEGLVVTGTAIAAQKREVGNSISLITAEQIESIPGMGVEGILRGRTLGATVSGSANQPGAGSRLMLRGVNSVNGRQEPLVYVDGVRVMSDAWESSNGSLQGAESVTGLTGINPTDIERIEVIKGAAASTLFGTEASAGVIQIFTKRGRAGEDRKSVV